MIVNHTTSDEDLMQAYQNGNLLAFEILYARHKARIFGFLMKKLRNQFEAEEVFQSTFMKLHSSCQQYDPSFKFSPWLFTVCQSVLTDYLRKRNKRLVESNDDDFIDQIPAPQNNETESLPSLASLNENQRMALEMRYTEDLDFDEIAKKLQTSPASHLDMTNNFPFGGHGTPVEDLKAIQDALDSKTMPPLRYTTIHWSSRIKTDELEKIRTWIKNGLRELDSQNTNN